MQNCSQFVGMSQQVYTLRLKSIFKLAINTDHLVMRKWFLSVFIIHLFVDAGLAQADVISEAKKMVDKINQMNGSGNSSCYASGVISDKTPIDRKEFLNIDGLNESIKYAAKSVKPICWCMVSVNNCGTMFSIGNGQFLTTQHVIDSFEKFFKDPETSKQKCGWVTENNKPISINILKSGSWDKKQSGGSHDHSKDLILMQIDELKEIPGLKIAKSENLELRQKIYDIGFPAGRLPYVHYDMTYKISLASEGTITNLHESYVKANFVGVNGMSGGPIVSEDGELIGVFWGKERNERDEVFFKVEPLSKQLPPEESYFTPLKHIKEFLNKR